MNKNVNLNKSVIHLKTCQEYIKEINEDNNEKLIELDDPNELNKLAECYFSGNDVEKDYNKAFGLYEKGAKLGNEYGMYNLGKCYRRGLGVEQNYNKAIELYTKAMGLGVEEAVWELETLEEELKNIRKYSEINELHRCIK